MKYNPKIFRKNDIRGIYKKDFDLHFVQKLAKAFIIYSQHALHTRSTTYNLDKTDNMFCTQRANEKQSKLSSYKITIALGHDSRLSSPEITACMTKELQKHGAKVHFLGLVPSPLCLSAGYFFSDIIASIMITASHNPPLYNGFKMILNSVNICNKELLNVKKIIDSENSLSANSLKGKRLQKKHELPGQTKLSSVQHFEQTTVQKKQATKTRKKVTPITTDTHNTPIQQDIKTLSFKKNSNSITNKLEEAYIENLKLLFLSFVPDYKITQNKKQNITNLLKQSIKKHKKLKLAIDCGNGTSGPIAKKVFKTLGLSAHWLYSKPNGLFPNHHPDPSIEENLKTLQQTVVQKKYDFGAAFDGDGDRLVLVDKKGRTLHGDELMALFITDILTKQQTLQTKDDQKATHLKNIKQKHLLSKTHLQINSWTCRPKLKKPNIVVDVKCADWFFKLLNQYKANITIAASGHSLIRQKTLQKKAIFGGELSGHFFFCDKGFPIDDGLYSLLRLICILLQTKKSLQQLIPVKKTYETYEIRIPITDKKQAQKKLAKLKHHYKTKSQAKCLFTDGVRVSVRGGWALARMSNTQSEMTLRFGGQSKKLMQNIQQKFYQILQIKKQ